MNIISISDLDRVKHSATSSTVCISMYVTAQFRSRSESYSPIFYDKVEDAILAFIWGIFWKYMTSYLESSIWPPLHVWDFPQTDEKH